MKRKDFLRSLIALPLVGGVIAKAASAEKKEPLAMDVRGAMQERQVNLILDEIKALHPGVKIEVWWTSEHDKYFQKHLQQFNLRGTCTDGHIFAASHKMFPGDDDKGKAVLRNFEMFLRMARQPKLPEGFWQEGLHRGGFSTGLNSNPYNK